MSNLPEKSTVSQSFIAKVKKQYAAEMGSMLAWSGLEATLAQHLFLKIDATLTDLQSKGKNVNWGNINMAKLAIDAPHIVALGLDGCIKNHINVIPYWNEKKKLNDLRISPGYEGEALARLKNAVYPVVDYKAFLLYKGDVFVPRFSSLRGDDFDYIPANALNPGDASMVEGGFGFITYEDPRRNKLRIVTMDEMKRAESSGGPLWKGQDRKAMMLKTVVWRTVEEIQLDPAKVNSFRHMMAMALEETAAEMDEEIAAKANSAMLTMKPLPGAPDEADELEGEMVEELGTAAMTETAHAEAPAQGPVTDAAPADKETQEVAPPSETGTQAAKAPSTRLTLSAEQQAVIKALLPAGTSPTLFKAAAEKDGVATYEDLRARAEALAPKVEEPGY